jgi:hypothetical protein
VAERRVRGQWPSLGIAHEDENEEDSRNENKILVSIHTTG